MSTARELETIFTDTERRLAPMRARVARLVDDLMVISLGREVGAQRARKLRRRGDRVVRLARPTSTGKARFCWIKRITFSFTTRQGTEAAS